MTSHVLQTNAKKKGSRGAKICNTASHRVTGHIGNQICLRTITT
jgi:hypothetical protein